MPNGTLGILLIGFVKESIDLQVLETSQGGSHPQKELVLALLHTSTFEGQIQVWMHCLCLKGARIIHPSHSPSLRLYSYTSTILILPLKSCLNPHSLESLGAGFKPSYNRDHMTACFHKPFPHHIQ